MSGPDVAFQTCRPPPSAAVLTPTLRRGHIALTFSLHPYIP